MAAEKQDPTEMLAELAGMKTALSGVNLSLPDLISQHASLTTGKAAFDGEIAKLKGDSSKLVSGAALPTDLVAAANAISAKDTEIATLKSEKMTLDAAVAKEVAKLGFAGGKKEEAGNGKEEKKLTATERVLQAKGCKNLDELEAKAKTDRNK